MTKKDKIKEEVIDKTWSIMLNLSDRAYDMSKQHEYNFLTLVWFLIATAAVIITSDWILDNVKTILTLSIIFLSIWLFLSNNLTWAQIIKYAKGIFALSKTTESLNLDEITSVQEKAEGYLKTKTVDIVFTAISSLCLNAWFILFLIWLIKFI